MSRDICFPGRGTHITRKMCFPERGTHITGICVSRVGEDISLGNCVFLRTHITRDMCFPGRGTHITCKMRLRERGTHITRDMICGEREF